MSVATKHWRSAEIWLGNCNQKSIPTSVRLLHRYGFGASHPRSETTTMGFIPRTVNYTVHIGVVYTFRCAHWVTFPRECIYNGYYIELAEKRARVQRDSRLKAIARQCRWTRFFADALSPGLSFSLSLSLSLSLLLSISLSCICPSFTNSCIVPRYTAWEILPIYRAMRRLCTYLLVPSRRNDPPVDFDSCLIHRSIDRTHTLLISLLFSSDLTSVHTMLDARIL